MNPAQLREALGAGYDLDERHGVWMARGAPEFAYADGGEAYVGEVIRSAADVATGSPELARAIRDWASQYHLSPGRANLLRPIAERIGDTVLEVGAGCGAITRFLGESGAAVLAVEGNPARARIAAARCRGLDNVVVVCDNFERLALPGVRFTLVTLIGVLEYSPVFVGGEDPVQAMLALARARVADSGLLAIAIENQLGAKYLAGAAEDHLGEPWVGVTGGYGPGTAITFGRRELEQRVRAAGFAAVEMAYPFPDYKLPAAIVTEAGFANPAFNVSDLIACAKVQRFDETVTPAFSEALARDTLVRNGLGADTANSFLCLAGDVIPAKAGIRAGAGEVLAYAYSVARDRPYAGEARFAVEDGGVVVQRRAIYPAAPTANSTLAMERPARERYLTGELLYRGLQRVTARRGWSLSQVAEWAVPWVELLRARASRDGKLPPELFDCTPFNVVRDAAGKLSTFDLEWRPERGPALEEVVFRGLYNALLRIDTAAAPASGTSTHIPSLAVATMHAMGFEITPEQAHLYIAADYALTGEIAGTPRAAVLPHLPVLRIAGAFDPVPLASSPAAAAGPRLGAIVHLYYEDLWPEIRAFIARIPSLERLYVSVGEKSAAGLEEAIARDFPGARVRRFPNRGRDVLPFLEFLNEAARDDIELVCKVHGKRSPHVATGDAWRRDMLEKLLGSEAAVRAIVQRFRADPALGIVGPGGHVVPASFYWKRNAEKVAQLCDRLGYDVGGVEFRYVAGSMFWARVKALAPLLRLSLRAEDFEPEPAPADGTLAHALERIFPLAARISGLRIDETDNPGGTTVRDFAP